MNTLKLSLSNFQAISNGELEFKTGLNFIIGQSNSGKTATFRAVKDCLLNPSKAARHIKNGEKEAAVTLSYNENTITWKRTQSSSIYEINGQEYIKVGRSSAFKLLENETGFVLSSSGIIMNIEEELQAPFPFGMSKQDLFKLYEDVFCISDSAIILKAAKGQEEQVKFDISNLENESIKNNKKIEELEKFKQEVDLGVLQGMKNSLLEKNTKVTKLKEDLPLIRKIEQLSKITVKEEGFENFYIKYAEKLSNKILMDKLKKLHSITVDLKSLPLLQPSLLLQYEELLKLYKEKTFIEKLSAIEVPEIFIDNKLLKYLEIMEISRIKEILINLKEFKLPSFTSLDRLEEYKKLTSLSEEIKELQKLIQDKERRSIELNEKINLVSSKLEKFDVCPLCGRPLKE